MGQNLAFITHCLNDLSRSLFYRHWDRPSGNSDSFDTTFDCKHFILHGFYATLARGPPSNLEDGKLIYWKNLREREEIGPIPQSDSRQS